jgi:hypothetical protein
MAKLCRIATAAMLAVHITVGCCAHHAHGCEGKDCSSSAHGDATHDGQCPGRGAGNSHHGSHDCHGEKCSFVSPSRTVSDSLVLPFQAFFAPSLDNQLPPVGMGRGRDFLASGRLLLPVRLHLANQVLLI